LCGRFEEHLVKMAAEACIQLTEGEVMEERLRHNASVSFEGLQEVDRVEDGVAVFLWRPPRRGAGRRA
jgi:hypothetical protein